MRSPIYILSLVAFILLGSRAYATTYYTLANGDFETGTIWNTNSAALPAAGIALPTLVANDILVIYHQVTVGATFTITPTVTINLISTSSTMIAKLIFANGRKLTLASLNSVINLSNTTGNSLYNPVIDGSGSGSSNTIEIGTGNVVWKAGNGDITTLGQLNKNSVNGSLPIKLSFFKAKQSQNSVLIEWATSSQENFDKFIVQRSTNGTDFVSLTEIKGEGFDVNNIENKYSYSDENPVIGVTYYRLKAVDLDATFEYFKAVMVDFKSSKNLTVQVNPSTGYNLAYSTNFTPSETDNVKLIGSRGETIQSSSATTFNGEIVFDSVLSPGVYILKYFTEGSELTARVLVR